MTTRKTCDKCEHYTKAESFRSNQNNGRCALMGDSNDVETSADRCTGWDYESYTAGVYVGPKFGCIHWTKKSEAMLTASQKEAK